MVAIVLIHMVQVFYSALTNFRGTDLELSRVSFADERWHGLQRTSLAVRSSAYWGLGIGASIASRVPIAGPPIVKLMLGGPIIAGATLSRFFALHVFEFPEC